MCTGNGPDWPSEKEEVKPVELESHPKYGLRIVARTGSRWDSHPKDETKQCVGCEHLRAVISRNKTGYTVSPEKIGGIAGICVWGKGWKIVYKSDKPKKCALVKGR